MRSKEQVGLLSWLAGSSAPTRSRALAVATAAAGLLLFLTPWGTVVGVTARGKLTPTYDLHEVVWGPPVIETKERRDNAASRPRVASSEKRARP